MTDKETISRYLSDTYSIREIVESFSPLNPDEKGVSNSILAPWSLNAISTNTGIPVKAVEEYVQNSDGLYLENIENEGLKSTVVKTDREVENVSSGHLLETDAHLTISELMNLHVLQFVRTSVSKTDRPAKVEDAIFDLKNSLFLPDDFMPEHLMGMVEGDSIFNSQELRRSFAILSGRTSLYFYQEQKQNGEGRIRFLYPAASGTLENAPSNEEIRERISTSFQSIQNKQSYLDFVNSRMIKTVIFNIEQKNTRELKRPIFNPAKIKILEDMGLVERNGDVASIREDMSLESLNDVYSKAKDKGSKLSKEWLSSLVGAK